MASSNATLVLDRMNLDDSSEPQNERQAVAYVALKLLENAGTDDGSKATAVEDVVAQLEGILGVDSRLVKMVEAEMAEARDTAAA